MLKRMHMTLAVALLAVVVGCSTRTVRVDPDQEPENRWGYTGTSSQDLRTTAQKMAEAILQVPQIVNAQNPPTIAFVPMKNNTSEYVDTSAFQDQIRGILIKYAGAKVRFVDRQIQAKILQERGLKREGVVGSAGEKTLLGVDYFLTGQIDGIDTRGRGRQSTYMRYSFRLTDAESGAIIWQDQYEVKKAALKPIWDR